MGPTNEHVGSKILAKIKIYILTRAGLLFQVCYEIPCNYKIGETYLMNLLKDGRMILSLLIPKYLYHRLFIIYLHGLILEKSNKKVSGFYFAASKKY